MLHAPPAVADWSDAEIGLALKELKTTPLEVLTDTPIGPFLVLSAIAIWRDGMGPWGIAPCREYLDVCAPGGLLSFMYFGQKPFCRDDMPETLDLTTRPSPAPRLCAPRTAQICTVVGPSCVPSGYR